MLTWENKTIDDALADWDKGEPVWSCEMGGIGPGYEQCIQLMGFEMLRAMRDNPPKEWKKFDDDKDAWRTYCDGIEATAAVKEIISRLQPSGAQFGAAMNIASVFARNGYAKGVEIVPEKRRIMVSKTFPV